MEGLIPFLVHAIKKQRQPANVYRCLSNNSTGRSYHLLLGEGSSDQFQPPHAVDVVTAGSDDQFMSPFCASNGLKLRAFGSGNKSKN
ncbi:hypothetical protein F511_32409 [Dorcoceras hygrometricum]|uniref:Uncharacterized protein n=1 Tax=Dorcoceras hygrometricum TaxID=472368 RepID=A0A2Z7BW15_9LAMI|nr:hypothetical protein F511_32409 [Dorcoceras hygrometricum]